jgi:SAM-dependent methyltransferase
MISARYDAVADFYVSGFDSVDDPVSAAFLDVLGPVSGLRVLDVACGHGRFTRALARRGAEVTGLDLSGRLLTKAREIEEQDALGISYVHADVAAPPVLAGAPFDRVTCFFGMSDIDDLDGAISAVAAVLRPGGFFVFAILHPCFAGAGDISGSWPGSGSYYDEGRWTANGARSTLRRQVGASHRMLSNYLNTLRRHGLRAEQIAEPAPKPDWDQAHVADRQPVFLVVSCSKDSQLTAGSPDRP